MNRRPFLQGFIITLSYLTGAFFAWYYNFLQTIFKTDFTHMTSVIAIVFVITCVYLGFAAWRCESNIQRAIADVALGRTMAFIVTLIGLLGTAIGLMVQVKAMGSIDVSNIQNVLQFIATIGTALSTALYSTVCGILASIGITILNSNIEYVIDSNDT